MEIASDPLCQARTQSSMDKSTSINTLQRTRLTLAVGLAVGLASFGLPCPAAAATGHAVQGRSKPAPLLGLKTGHRSASCGVPQSKLSGPFQLLQLLSLSPGDGPLLRPPQLRTPPPSLGNHHSTINKAMTLHKNCEKSTVPHKPEKRTNQARRTNREAYPRSGSKHDRRGVTTTAPHLEPSTTVTCPRRQKDLLGGNALISAMATDLWARGK